MEKAVILKKIKEKFGNRLDISYVGDATAKNQYKVTLVCSEHGKFTKNIYTLLGSGTYGCTKCNRERSNDWHKKSYEEVLNICRNLHKNYYDYSDTEHWQNLNDKVHINCPEHGQVEIVIGNHLEGAKCRQCAVEIQHEEQRNSSEDILERIKKIHGDRYAYPKMNYTGMYNLINILCSEHGNFQMTAKDHIKGNGCPYCAMSSIEAITENYLKQKSYSYTYQYKDQRCKIKKELPFDFAILDSKEDIDFLIECQGVFHYKPVYSEEDFQRIKKSDNIKKSFCLNNNIKLIELPYWIFDNNFNKNITNIIEEIIV